MPETRSANHLLERSRPRYREFVRQRRWGGQTIKSRPRRQQHTSFSLDPWGHLRWDNSLRVIVVPRRPAPPFPSPQEPWQCCFPQGNAWRDCFGAVPFEIDGGKWQPRYYQHNAIHAVLEAIAHGEERILLTLATGTGKTSIAFQTCMEVVPRLVEHVARARWAARRARTTRWRRR